MNELAIKYGKQDSKNWIHMDNIPFCSKCNFSWGYHFLSLFKLNNMAQREIKFRGLRIDNGQWAYGYYVYDNNTDRAYIYNVYINSNDVPTLQRDEVIPNTVGQYTGINDKNGTCIYEGDKLSAEISDGQDVQFSVHLGDTFELMNPEDGYYGWYCKYTGGSYPDIAEHYCQLNRSSESCEVIGNIHTHPELLK